MKLLQSISLFLLLSLLFACRDEGGELFIPDSPFYVDSLEQVYEKAYSSSSSNDDFYILEHLVQEGLLWVFKTNIVETTVYCINLDNGELEWSRTFTTLRRVGRFFTKVHEDLLLLGYTAGDSPGILALNKNTGQNIFDLENLNIRGTHVEDILFDPESEQIIVPNLIYADTNSYIEVKAIDISTWNEEVLAEIKIDILPNTIFPNFELSTNIFGGKFYIGLDIRDVSDTERRYTYSIYELDIVSREVRRRLRDVFDNSSLRIYKPPIITDQFIIEHEFYRNTLVCFDKVNMDTVWAITSSRLALDHESGESPIFKSNSNYYIISDVALFPFDLENGRLGQALFGEVYSHKNKQIENKDAFVEIDYKSTLGQYKIVVLDLVDGQPLYAQAEKELRIGFYYPEKDYVIGVNESHIYAFKNPL